MWGYHRGNIMYFKTDDRVMENSKTDEQVCGHEAAQKRIGTRRENNGGLICCGIETAWIVGLVEQ